MACINAILINVLKDDLTSTKLREAGTQGTKKIFLQGNVPADVIFGKLSDDFNTLYSFITCAPACLIII